MEKINDFIKLKSYKVFIFNCLLYFVALFLEFRYIFTNEFYAQNLNHYTEKQVFDFILLERNAEWANYVFAIGLVLMSSLLIATILYIGFNLKTISVSFRKSYRIAVQSIVVFSLNYLISVSLKLFGVVKYDINNVNDVYAYQSVLRFLNTNKIPQWALYPLEKINISEFVYFAFLAILIHLHFKMTKKTSLKYAMAIYGSGLFIWIVITVFIQFLFYT
ncbi:MAG: hypothetical protein ACK5KP_08795 [Paludibacteraceae bacterium]